MTRFLRDLIKIPGESCGEEAVARRILAEMQKLGFDKAELDPMGNVQGWMGAGKTLIAYDGHIDTVGLGELSNWKFDPYEGYETETEIGGRGASDQRGGVVSAVYGAKIMKDLGLLSDKYTVLVTGTVQEEDCDGLCWQYIFNESKIRPEFVVITEPTNGNIYRGQRGRMEIRVEVKGISCHGSAPERGDNAIYKMADIIQEVRALNDKLHCDPFLGKGTLAVSQSFYNSPSRCAVADMAAISIDRRLTDGETWEGALEEIRALPSVQKYNAVVSMYTYDRPAWTGLVYPTECYFPTWVIPETHPATKAMWRAIRECMARPRWISGLFPPTGSPSWAATVSPASALGRARKRRPTPPTKRRGRKTWRAARRCTRRCPLSTANKLNGGCANERYIQRDS
jgi:putative selenium metabolism hydrolase